MKRIPLRAALLAFAALLLSTSALAAPAQSFTQTFKDAVDVDPNNVNPCTGDPGTLTTVENGVIHVTLTANGGFHLTGTFTGALEFVPDDPSKPTLTGRSTIWFGDNDNARSGVETVTFTVHAEGSDGSTVRMHSAAHFSVSATGLVVSFDKLRCG